MYTTLEVFDYSTEYIKMAYTYNRIQDLKQQTELLEVQCEAVQQELSWQYLILKQTFDVESR
jgi:hypothetical protein